MNASSRLGLLPLANVHVESPGMVGECWLSTSEDPQFLLGGPRLDLAPGWYIFEARSSQVQGRLASPCLYPDYGEGMAEAGRIPLPEPDADGIIRAVVLFERAVRALRFDPSILPVRFSMPQVLLRALGRTAALWNMCALIVRKSGWEAGLAPLREFLRYAAAGRLREGGDAAFATYRRHTLPGLQGDGNYAAWVRVFDTFGTVEERALHARLQAIQDAPLISVVLPVYQPPERWLRRCIDSVLAQVYQNWELCIADDASASPHVRRVLAEYARRDARIRVVYRGSNGHISAASNSALEIAKGRFVALLDHDDELAPDALAEVALAIAAHPQWRLIYSDEDKIDAGGVRYDPYFKPDWNYELLLSQNFISHLGVYDSALVREVGGFRVGLEGSQDWDLALRCIERLEPGQIGHIPKILYHWRSIPGSTALAVGEKDYVGAAGLRAVREHLVRTDAAATAEPAGPGRVRVRRSIPGGVPRVSLIVPTRDRVDLLRVCVDSLLQRTDYADYEVLVVDNQSQEAATLAYLGSLSADSRVRVLRYDRPFNYSAINNFAAAHANGELLGLLNNDIEVESGSWLAEMVSEAVRPGVGAVGAMLLYPDETIQHAGVIVGMHGVAGHLHVGKPRSHPGQMGRALAVQELSAVTAACMLLRKSAFEAVGGLDEGLAVAFNDIDLCLRLKRAGYRNLWTPHAVLFHHESASRGYEDTPEKKARFNAEVQFMRDRWGGVLDHDPAYNCNLSLDGEAFELAFPPRGRRRCLSG